ncbi:hypothetical protein [Streptomyces asiaticus]|uniref:hypothetical protein n=1 Tax=Streptomyces asiaticus TaxID=114695 RepID=UPI003F678CA1
MTSSRGRSPPGTRRQGGRNAARGDSAATARADDRTGKLKLKIKTQECTRIHEQLDTSATVIAALRHDNEAMRDHIGSRGSRVVSLDSRRGTD